MGVRGRESGQVSLNPVAITYVQAGMGEAALVIRSF